METIPEDSDLESLGTSGNDDDPLACHTRGMCLEKGRMLSMVTTSTMATMGNEDTGASSSFDGSVEMEYPSHHLSKGGGRGGGMDGGGRMRCERRPNRTLMVSIVVAVMILFALIATVVVTTANQDRSDPKTSTLSGNNKMGMGTTTVMGGFDDDSLSSFWNPVCDLRVVYDPDNYSQYILRDDKDVCQPRVVEAAKDKGDVLLEWTGVQPTAESIAVLGIMPHIQTGGDHYVELNSDTGIVLGPDNDWTLSFSGARLDETSMVDTIFSGRRSDERKSTFALCYMDDNSIGLGSCHSEDSTTIVSLPFSVLEFHILTLTYSRDDGYVQIYQNTEWIDEFNYSNATENNILSFVGQPDVDDHDDPEESSSSSSSTSNGSSRIALRHVAFLDKHLEAGNVVDIADLALHMST